MTAPLRTSELRLHNGQVTKLTPSIAKIMDGALRGIAARGMRRVSMSDISEASGISRGTLYRYFPTKEDVMAAVSEFISVGFEDGVRGAANSSPDPMQRFHAVMEFYLTYTNQYTPDQIFELEPNFHIQFFRSHFERHKAAVREALAITFDYLDTLADLPVGRDGLTEALVRLQLSSLIIPNEPEWNAIWTRIPEHVENWLIALAGRRRVAEEI